MLSVTAKIHYLIYNIIDMFGLLYFLVAFHQLSEICLKILSNSEKSKNEINFKIGLSEKWLMN